MVFQNSKSHLPHEVDENNFKNAQLETFSWQLDWYMHFP